MYKRSTIQAQTLGLCISRCAADMLCDRLDYQVLNYGSIYFCKLSLIQRWKNGFNVLSKGFFLCDNFPRVLSQVKWQLPKCAISQTATSQVSPRPIQYSLQRIRVPNLWNCRFRNCSFGKLPLGKLSIGKSPWGRHHRMQQKERNLKSYLSK